MEKYTIKKRRIEKIIRIVFLCGTEYGFKDIRDKRNVLKGYLEKIDEINKPIILEQNFIFGKNLKEYMSYDNIFLKNLHDVELLIALLSDQIYIIHESISTAAELGVLASNEELSKKICLIVPDITNVEEAKISTFIDMAFFQNQNNIHNITFYPLVQCNRVSKNKSDYHTYFPNNRIDGVLGEQIKEFNDRDSKSKIEIKFKKGIKGNLIDDKYTISYVYRDNYVLIQFSVEIIKTLIISMFNIKSLKSELRKSTDILGMINVIEKFIKDITLNSIQEIESKDIKDMNIKIIIKEIENKDIGIRNVIGFILYILQAMKYIVLPVGESTLSIKNNFENIYQEYIGFIGKKVKSGLF